MFRIFWQTPARKGSSQASARTVVCLIQMQHGNLTGQAHEASIHVAIVDDDASLCKALSRLLTAADMSSTIYYSAEAFLTDGLIREPDCLILDIQLSGMTGLELQRCLRATHRHVPVIFITAHDQPELREQALRDGCIAYLRKNDSGETLLATVRSALKINVDGRPGFATSERIQL
jgi:FixJ family two-component response regulator